MRDISKLEDGFYNLTTFMNMEGCLVKLYTSKELGRVIGFGAWDGGNILKLSDITSDTILERLVITRLDDWADLKRTEIV